jgi:hypothetical protein
MTAIPDPRATLIAEIGNLVTRVTLVDAVEGEARLISQVELPSTIDPPHENALIAVVAAARQIAEMTGRQLVHNNTLIVPQNSERDGVDAVVAVTSAAGMIGIVIAAVSSDVSARSALHASRAVSSSVLQIVTLDDAARNGAGSDIPWIERQVQLLTGIEPDCVILAGGLEGGAEDTLVRLAHIIGLTAATAQSEGNARLNGQLRPVIYAGNSEARGRVVEALAGRAEVSIVDNLRPDLTHEHLDPARRELARIYKDRILASMGGVSELQRLLAAPLRTGAEATGLMVRFIAERYDRSVLAADVGSAQTSLYLAEFGRYSPAILGGIGSGHGVSGVIAEHGLASIARWLPFPIDERELAHRLLNKSLRPHQQPITREELFIELAVAREALGFAFTALLDERPNAVFDMVIACGSALAGAPHPGYTALVLLDALQMTADETVFAVDLHVDSLGLLAACGALAFAEPDAALTLFERDLLQNAPLATCVVALGAGRSGETAIDAELTIVGGETQRVSIPHGAIARLPLPPGRRGTLTVRPASGVRIGRNAPGTEVASEEAAISGSQLGVVIDARGRPLRLPEAPYTRQQALWEWLVALGAERGPLPYEEAMPFVDAPVIDVPDAPSSSAPPRISEPHLDAPSSGSIESDLARLRQTVEQPKKRGIFRR